MADDGTVSAESVEMTERLVKAMEQLGAVLPLIVKQMAALAAGADDLSGSELQDAIEKFGGGLEDFGATMDEAGRNLGSLKKGLAGMGDAMAGAIGINSKLGNSMKMNATLLLKDAGARKMVTQGFKQAFHPMNLIVSLNQKLFESTMDLMYATDKSLVSFNKSTGAHKLYANEITNLEKEMHEYNISIGDVGESYTSMTTTIMSLNKMSKANRKEVATTTAMLNELGVNTDTTANNIQFLTAVLGESGKQAAKTQRDLFVLAQAVGMPPQQMADDFKNAMPKLAAFGKQSTEVFKKMAINARAAGMSVEQMMNITEKFDKFDTAAEAVGRLNAALGGPYLSTLEMVTTTDPTERMKLMSNAIRETGKSFDSMEYYEAKMIASSMGLADVNELALVMKGNFDLLPGAVKKTSSEIEALARQTADFNEVSEVASTLMRQFAIALGPVLSGVKSMIMGFVRLLNVFPVVKAGLAVLVLAFVAAAFAIRMSMAGATLGTSEAIAWLITAIGAYIAAAALLYSYIGNLGDIFDNTTVAALALKIGIIALAAAFLFLSGPIMWIVGILAAAIYVVIQLFVYWNDIIDYFTQALAPLIARLKVLQDRFAALGPAGEGLNLLDIIKSVGKALLWLNTMVLYYVIDIMLTLYEVTMPFIELLDLLIYKTGLWKVILGILLIPLGILAVALFVSTLPLILIIGLIIGLVAQFWALLKVVKFVQSLIRELRKVIIELATEAIGFLVGKLKEYILGISYVQTAMAKLNGYIALATLYWTSFKVILSKVAATAKNTVQPAIDGLSDAFGIAATFVQPLTDAIGTVNGALGSFMSAVWEGMSPSTMQTLEALQGAFVYLGDALRSPIDAISELLDKLLEFAKFMLDSAFSKAIGMVSSIGSALGFGGEIEGALTGTTNIKGAETGGVKREDSYAEIAMAVGEQVAKQMAAVWKELPPLAGKVAIDAVINPNPLFTFVSQGLDLQEAGKPMNHSKNMIMAGGKTK